jgi:hypothetical protein
MLRIYIALSNTSPSVGFEPANLGANGKHANHYTTGNENIFYLRYISARQ